MVGLRCPNAQQCVDPFHVVSWVVEAVDKVRRRKMRGYQEICVTK
jgi:transposase